MTGLSDEQRAAIESAGWTEEEVSAFGAALDRFRAGLGDKQRGVFDEMLAMANDTASGDDVSGYLVVPAVIAVIIPLLLPPVDKSPRSPRVGPGNMPPPPPPPPPPVRPPV